MSMDANAGGSSYVDDDDVEMIPIDYDRNRDRRSPSLTPLTDSESVPDYGPNVIASSYQADQFPGATPQSMFELTGTPTKRDPRELSPAVHIPFDILGDSAVNLAEIDPFLDYAQFS